VRVKPSIDIEVTTRKTDKQRRDRPRKTIRRVTRMTMRGSWKFSS
jgi:hypothetical protein